MEFFIFFFCIVLDVYLIIDFFKPIFNKKYLREGYKLKFISPIWNYIILALALLVSFYYLFMYIKERAVNDIILFNMIFIVIIFEMSKSYALICKEGIIIGGVYFSNAEKKEGQYIKKIMLWNRRIYAIKTTSKYAYVYIRRKYCEIMNG